MRKLLLLFIYPLLLLLGGCSGEVTSEPALREAARILDNEADSVKDAIRMLASLDTTLLSKGDRSLHTLLSVKAADKSYIPHTDPSSILNAVEYEKAHQSRGLYPEALYYAGRVYTDLGDYPTAVHYYEDGLMALNGNQDNKKLKIKILNFLGETLVNIYLYESADTILSQAIELAEELKDYYSKAVNLELLGIIESNRHNDEKSLNYLYQAKTAYVNSTEPDTISVMAKIALIKSRNGSTKEAMDIIRNLPQTSDSISRSYILSIAAAIYRDTNFSDTAFMYAKKLLDYPDFTNRHVAYNILLNPRLSEFVPVDTLRTYAFSLTRELSRHYARRDSVQSIHQQSFFNYSIHESKRRDAELRSYRARMTTWILLSWLCIAILIFCLREINRKKERLSLQNTIAELRLKLQEAQSSLSLTTRSPSSGKEIKDRAISIENLMKRVSNIVDNEKEVPILEDTIAGSAILKKFRESIFKNQVDNNDWILLEKEILKVSPDLKNYLSILTGKNLNEAEFRVALLIRCHFRPSEISHILNVKSGTISKQRGDISRKIFNKNIGTKIIDRIIKSL